MSEMLSLSSKSSYKAYEEERALPDIHKLMKLAQFFDVGISELVYQDIEHLQRQEKAPIVKLYSIPKIPVAASAGYAKSFGDQNYIRTLNTISIPFEPPGNARAFDISGDSMEPEIQNGSTVIGVKLSRDEIRNNKPYIIVTSEGVQCKQIWADETSELLYLISINKKYAPKHVRKSEVMEVWNVWKVLESNNK